MAKKRNTKTVALGAGLRSDDEKDRRAAIEKVVAAIMEAGSMRGAARMLGVQYRTFARWLQQDREEHGGGIQRELAAARRAAAGRKEWD